MAKASGAATSPGLTMRPLLGLLLLVMTASSPVHAACPSEDWHVFKGKCYRFVDHLWTWTDALDACDLIQPGATLASVRDLEENAFLAETVCGYSEAWIGFRSPDSYKAWEWVDGSPTNFSKWDRNQPSGGGEQCAMTNAYNSGEWFSELCDGYHTNFICQTQDT